MSRTRNLHGEGVLATLQTANGAAYKARVLATTVVDTCFFVDVRFVDKVPQLASLADVLVSFTGSRIRGTPSARCRHVPDGRDLEQDCVRLQADLFDRGGLAGLVERRGAERLPVSAAPLVEVRWKGSRIGSIWKGSLIDLSSSGLQVGFSTATDPALAVGQRVMLSFELQGADAPFEFGAELQYRRPGGGRVAYGMRFLREPSDAFRILEGRLFGVLIGLACGPG